MRSKRHTLQGTGSKQRMQGFNLVEVLIALIILSVGMLGIAGLYVHSMQAGRTSLFRHHAVTLAGDVADRIRANPSALAAYAALAGADNNCIAGGKNCTPGEMAANDILLWQQQATDTLGISATVAVVVDPTVVPPTYQITVSWPEAGYDTPRSYSITIPVFDI